MGMRCFACLGTSRNLARHLPAAVSACKSHYIVKLLPGRLLWAAQRAVSAPEKGLQRRGEGLEGTVFSTSPSGEVPVAPPLPPGHHPPTGSQSTAHRTCHRLLFQPGLWVSLTVFKEGFSTVFIPFAQPRRTCTHTSDTSRHKVPFLLPGRRGQ